MSWCSVLLCLALCKVWHHLHLWDVFDMGHQQLVQIQNRDVLVLVLVSVSISNYPQQILAKWFVLEVELIGSVMCLKPPVLVQKVFIEQRKIWPLAHYAFALYQKLNHILHLEYKFVILVLYCTGPQHAVYSGYHLEVLVQVKLLPEKLLQVEWWCSDIVCDGERVEIHKAKFLIVV